MATIELSMISKEKKSFPVKDKDGNVIREEERMVPKETTTFQLEADDSALQAAGGLFSAPKNAEWYEPTGRDAAVAAITVGTLAAGGHGLMGERVQGVIHSIFGAKK